MLTPLINRQAVKRHALAYCEANRPRFTRVSKQFLERIDTYVKNKVNDEIHRHPSLGKTLK
jgi:hypothetical protein